MEHPKKIAIRYTQIDSSLLAYGMKPFEKCGKRHLVELKK
jgi:hypothetical protein